MHFARCALPLYSKVLHNVPKKLSSLRAALKTATDTLAHLAEESVPTPDLALCLVLPLCQSFLLVPAPKVTMLCLEIVEEVFKCPAVHSLVVDPELRAEMLKKSPIVKVKAAPWWDEETLPLEALRRAYRDDAIVLPAVLANRLETEEPLTVKTVLLSFVVIVALECVDLPLVKRVCKTLTAYVHDTSSVTSLGVVAVVDTLVRSCVEFRDAAVQAHLRYQLTSIIGIVSPPVASHSVSSEADGVVGSMTSAVTEALQVNDDLNAADIKRARKMLGDSYRRSTPVVRRTESKALPARQGTRVTTFKAAVPSESPPRRSSRPKPNDFECDEPDFIRIIIEVLVYYLRCGTLPMLDPLASGLSRMPVLLLEILHVILTGDAGLLLDKELQVFTESHLLSTIVTFCLDSNVKVHAVAFAVLDEVVGQIKRVSVARLSDLCRDVFVPLLESPVAPYPQKKSVLDLLSSRLTSDPIFVHDLYDAHDAALGEPATAFKLVDAVAKIAQGGVDAVMAGYTPQQVSDLRRKALEAITTLVLSFSMWLDHVPSPASSEAYAVLRARRRSKLDFNQCLTTFNSKPKRGVQALIDQGFLADDPVVVAEFLMSKSLSKDAVGNYLGEHAPFCQAVMREYIQALHFGQSPIHEAVRSLLSHFRLPGEPQKIERIVEQFASSYFRTLSPDSPIKSQDCAFVLTFSLIMLHTDAHSKEVRPESKMTKEQFIKNNGGINDGTDLPRDFLGDLYDAVTAQEWTMEEDDLQRQRTDVSVEASSSLAVALGFSQSTLVRRRQELFNVESSNWLFNFENPQTSPVTLQSDQPLLVSLGLTADDLTRRFEIVVHEAMWNILPTYAYMLETFVGDTSELLCVTGLRHLTKIACYFSLTELRGAAIAAIAKAAGLHVQSTKLVVGVKEIRACRELLSIAKLDFRGVGDNWFSLLFAVSEIDRLLRAAHAVDPSCPVSRDLPDTSDFMDERTVEPGSADAVNGLLLAQYLKQDNLDVRSLPLASLDVAGLVAFFSALKDVARVHLMRSPPHVWPVVALLDASKSIVVENQKVFFQHVWTTVAACLRDLACHEETGHWTAEAWRDFTACVAIHAEPLYLHNIFDLLDFLLMDSSVRLTHATRVGNHFLRTLADYWEVLRLLPDRVMGSLEAFAQGLRRAASEVKPDTVALRCGWSTVMSCIRFLVTSGPLEEPEWRRLVPLLGTVSRAASDLPVTGASEALREHARLPVLALAALDALASPAPPSTGLKVSTDCLLCPDDIAFLTAAREAALYQDKDLLSSATRELLEHASISEEIPPVRAAALGHLTRLLQSNFPLVDDDLWQDFKTRTGVLVASLVDQIIDGPPQSRPTSRDSVLDVESWDDLSLLTPLALLSAWSAAWTDFAMSEVEAGRGKRPAELVVFATNELLRLTLARQAGFVSTELILKVTLADLHRFVLTCASRGLPEEQWEAVCGCLVSTCHCLMPVDLLKARRGLTDFKESHVLVQSSLLLTYLETLMSFLTTVTTASGVSAGSLASVTELARWCVEETFTFDFDVEGRQRLKAAGFFSNVKSIPGLVKHEKLALKTYLVALRRHVNLYPEGSTEQHAVIATFIRFAAVTAARVLLLEESDSANHGNQRALHTGALCDDILTLDVKHVISDANFDTFAPDFYPVVVHLVKSTNPTVCEAVQQILTRRFGPRLLPKKTNDEETEIVVQTGEFGQQAPSAADSAAASVGPASPATPPILTTSKVADHDSSSDSPLLVLRDLRAFSD